MPDQHVAESVRMISLSATRVGTCRAIVLGAGKCREIALAGLATLFGEIVLVDLDRAALDEGLAAAELAPDERRKVEIRLADLTGSTGDLERRWRAAIAAAADAQDAIERMAAVADAEQAGSDGPAIAATCWRPVRSGRRFMPAQPIARASGTRCRAIVCRAISRRCRAAAIGVSLADKPASAARRMEARFMDRLPPLVAPAAHLSFRDGADLPDCSWRPTAHGRRPARIA